MNDAEVGIALKDDIYFDIKKMFEDNEGNI